MFAVLSSAYLQSCTRGHAEVALPMDRAHLGHSSVSVREEARSVADSRAVLPAKCVF